MHTEIERLNKEIERLNKETGRLNKEAERSNKERFDLYESKIAMMEAHEKEKHKILAEAHANLLKMQVQAKESAVPGNSLP